MQHSIRAGHLYRNTISNKVYYVMGLYPHVKNDKVPDNLKEFVVVLSYVYPQEVGDRVLSYVPLAEFEKEIKIGEELMPRFIRVIESEYKDNSKPFLIEFDDVVTTPGSKIKQIKYLK